MANDKKTTQLLPLDPAINEDVFAIVDVSVGETKKIRLDNLMGSPGPIGVNNPGQGEFTTLKVSAGHLINEFSTDINLAGNSDFALPTEKAVKTYVDAHVGLANKILQGDSSVEVIDAVIGRVEVTIDAAVEATYNSSGLSLKSGTSINEFSTDVNLAGNSDNSIPTEKAIKTYVDNQISSVVGTVNIRHISSDSTAVSGDAVLVDTTAGDVNVELIELPTGKIIIKKITSDANKIIVTGRVGDIDGKNQLLVDISYQTFTILSDGLDFYVI